MHLRRTSLIALSSLVSLMSLSPSFEGLASAELTRQTGRQPPARSDHRQTGRRQTGIAKAALVSTLAAATVFAATCTVLPTMEGHLVPSGSDRRCTAVHVQADGSIAASYKLGVVLAAPVHFFNHSGVTFDTHVFTGAPPASNGTPTGLNVLAGKLTAMKLTVSHPAPSFGDLAIESGCEGASKPLLATVFSAAARALSK